MSNGPVAYDVDFEWDESHGRLVTLLIDRPERGIVVDLGCGYAPHAEVLRDAGFVFVGFDVDAASIDAIRARGFDGRLVDLGDRGHALSSLGAVVADAAEPLAAVLALDVIEHLVEPHLLLDQLSQWLRGHEQAVLGVSVPNIGHRDVAAKLLAGRWDVTPTGLLDQTHLRFFTDSSLQSLMEGASLVEVDRDDRPAVRSDQYWPAASPFVAPDARLGAALRNVRSAADDHSATYQFIRTYAPSGAATRPSLIASGPSAAGVVLSVLADPAMTDDEVERLNIMLDRQSNTSWELLRAGAGDFDFERTEMFATMLSSANGAYVSIVGPDDILRSDWVAQFADSALNDDEQPTGRILRCDVADGSSLVDVHPGVAELGPLDAPGAAFAIPLEAIRAFGLDVGDNSLPPTIELLLGAVQYCGVTATGIPALSGWEPVAIDGDAVQAHIDEIDRSPVLMEPGTLARVHHMERARLDAEARVAELSAQVDALSADNEWLNAELGAAPIRAVRRALRRPPSSR